MEQSCRRDRVHGLEEFAPFLQWGRAPPEGRFGTTILQDLTPAMEEGFLAGTLVFSLLCPSVQVPFGACSLPAAESDVVIVIFALLPFRQRECSFMMKKQVKNSLQCFQRRNTTI